MSMGDRSDTGRRELAEHVKQLKALVRELLAILAANSFNSSLLPPGARKAVTKKSKRKRDG